MKTKMRTMMTKKAGLKSGLILVAVAVSALPLSSAGQARYSFDGRWWVEAVAYPSKCSDKYAVAIQVANGQISGAFFGVNGGGSVDNNGKLSLHIDVVRASGALAATTGLGRWNSPTCNGTWTARRA
jgi:hypothetical protein